MVRLASGAIFALAPRGSTYRAPVSARKPVPAARSGCHIWCERAPGVLRAQSWGPKATLRLLQSENRRTRPAMDLRLRAIGRFWVGIASPLLRARLLHQRSNRGPGLPAVRCIPRPAAERSDTSVGQVAQMGGNIR